MINVSFTYHYKRIPKKNQQLSRIEQFLNCIYCVNYILMQLLFHMAAELLKIS